MAKICFIGNVSSMSYLLATELIKAGHEVDILGGHSQFQTNKFHKKAKPSLLHRAIRKYAKPIYRAAMNTKRYDIELRSFSQPIVQAKHRVVMYQGNDLRDHSWAIEYPCFYSTKDLGLLYLDPEMIRRQRAVWLPRCFVADFFQPTPRIPFDGKRLVICHMPTDPKLEEKGYAGKGSARLYAAVDVLKQRGYDVYLITPETYGHVQHEEMGKLYAQCHVVADQFTVGQYGITAMEAIACNRPVVCFVHPDFWEYESMKDQIVNCDPKDPNSVADALLAAVDHPVKPALVRDLYSPKYSAQILAAMLKIWGFLN